MRPARLTACLLTALVAISCAESTGPEGPGGGGDGLAVASVSPADGANTVSPTTSVSVVFSRAVDAASVTTTTFRVGSIPGTVSASGATATFTPDDPFPYASTQSVTVSGVRDVDGESMDGTFASSFTVAPEPAVAPTASAGADQQVSFGATVTLDATGSAGSNKSYAWTQLAGPSVGALTGATPSFGAPSDIALLRFQLTVTGDGPASTDDVRVFVLEDGAHAYFVAPTGSDAAAGSRTAPFATIQHAIDVADAAGFGGDVYVAEGTYDESLVLRSRVSVYGGFDAATWVRDVEDSRTWVDGQRIAVRAVEANNLSLDGFLINAANGSEAGHSSIGVFLRNSTGVVLRRMVIVTGDGATGVNGGPGANRSKASNGADGMNAGVCPPSRVGGGGGGSTFGRNGGGGGTGGFGGGFNGGAGFDGGGGAGSGGGAFGGNGTNGGVSVAARAAGAGGSAGNAFGVVGESDIGSVTADNGGGGANGWGGGGGGGGGGGFGCGGGGGGGGAGGQGGGGGQGGVAGAHSIGIVLSGATSANIINSDIALGNGGNGGNGGTGGAAGAGGDRGDGGSSNASGGAGGDGGDGQAGAHGGGGGGARGGWTIGVLEDVTATSTRTGVHVTPGSPGSGGTGGARSGGNAGANGSAGQAVDYRKLP